MATALIIILIAVGAGFLYNFLIEIYERYTHPLLYSEYIESYSSLYGVPEYIVYATVKTESSFKYDAVSPKGAVGLMQITPDTFIWLTSKTGEEFETEALYLPYVNIKYGVFFLGYLYNEFGSWETVFAAYNAGMAKVKSWLLDPQLAEDGRLKSIPYDETKNYVNKVSREAEIYRRLYYGE